MAVFKEINIASVDAWCKLVLREVLLFIENTVNSLGVDVLIEGEIFEALNEAFYHTRQWPEIYVPKILKEHINLLLKPKFPGIGGRAISSFCNSF